MVGVKREGRNAGEHARRSARKRFLILLADVLIVFREFRCGRLQRVGLLVGTAHARLPRHVGRVAGGKRVRQFGVVRGARETHKLCVTLAPPTRRDLRPERPADEIGVTLIQARREIIFEAVYAREAQAGPIPLLADTCKRAQTFALTVLGKRPVVEHRFDAIPVELFRTGPRGGRPKIPPAAVGGEVDHALGLLVSAPPADRVVQLRANVGKDIAAAPLEEFENGRRHLKAIAFRVAFGQFLIQLGDVGLGFGERQHVVAPTGDGDQLAIKRAVEFVVALAAGERAEFVPHAALVFVAPIYARGVVEDELGGACVGFVEPGRGRFVEREPVVELVEHDRACGGAGGGAIGFNERAAKARFIDAPAFDLCIFPAEQAPDQICVTRLAGGGKPRFEILRVVAPKNALPILSVRRPVGELIED